MKVNFSRDELPECKHEPPCYKWVTRDKRVLAVCLLTDDHLENILSMFRGNVITHPGYKHLEEEYSRRTRDKYKKQIPVTNDLVFAFKALRIEDYGYHRQIGTNHTGLQFGSMHKVWDKETVATCNKAGDSTQAVVTHLLDERSMMVTHGSLTGCGLYSFQRINPAIEYARGRNALALIRLYGVVVDVEFVDPFETGYLSEKAEIQRVWVPETLLNNNSFHPDARYVLEHKFDFPVQLVRSLEELRQ